LAIPFIGWGPGLTLLLGLPLLNPIKALVDLGAIQGPPGTRRLRGDRKALWLLF